MSIDHPSEFQWWQHPIIDSSEIKFYAQIKFQVGPDEFIVSDSVPFKFVMMGEIINRVGPNEILHEVQLMVRRGINELAMNLAKASEDALTENFLAPQLAKFLAKRNHWADKDWVDLDWISGD